MAETDFITGIVDGLVKVIQESNLFQLIGIIAGIVILCFVIGLFVILVVKTISKGRAYVGSTGHIGSMRISIRQSSALIGNVNRNTSFLTEKVLGRMKEIKQIKTDPVRLQGIMDMENLWKDNLLYAYDMKVTDSFGSDLPDDNILLLSPVKLEESYVSWDDEKGEWSWHGSATSMFRRFPKNIQCSELTEYYDVEDMKKKKKRVYILVVLTDVVDDKLILNPKGKIVKDVIRSRQVHVNMINLPNKHALAVLSLYIPDLDEMYKELEVREQRLHNVEQQNTDLNKLLNSMKTMLDGYRARIKTKPMIGEENPVTPNPPKSLYGIAIGGVIAGFIASRIAMIDQLAIYDGIEYAFLGVAVAVVLILIKMFDKPPSSQFTTERPGDKM